MEAVVPRRRISRTATVQELPIFGTEATRSELMAIYDERMRQWPVPYEEFFCATRFGRTHVIASGDRASAPLVLLHPMGAGAQVWSSIIARLSEKHRCYALDTIGDVGKSVLEDPDRYPKSGRDYSAWLDDTFAALDLDIADVVAGSMGGWIAISHAIYAPIRVRRLVLLGPMGLPSVIATAGVLGPMMSAVVRPTEAKRQRLIDRCLGKGERVNSEYRRWMELLVECRPRLGQPFHVPGWRLARIKAPTLVFLGGKDGLIGSATSAARRARRIPRSRVEILPNAGHVMSIDEPDVVGTRIVDFMEQQPG
jgi:pimeloyl-ACP methyl ester carboxylesterase